ncbi:MAG: DsrE/DsrF/TusD sulfur relay family protein [Candidatus Baldrarchaeia archaeon]
MSKTLTIVLLREPYASQYADIALEIAEMALNLGYKVRLFLYMSGVHAAKRGQSPLRFPNFERKLRELLTRGLKVIACGRCASARGYIENSANEEGNFSTSQYVEGVKVMSIYELADWIKNSDRVIMLG